MARHRAGRPLVLLFAAIWFRGSAEAQGPGTAPLVLLLPGGTRALGLGNAFVAGDGAEVVFYNPAQIGVQRGTALSIERFSGASTLGTFAAAGTLGKVAIAAGVQYLDYGAPGGSGLSTSPGLLTVRGPLGSSSLSATVAGAFRWKGFRFGAGAKYAEERVDVVREDGMAYDFGVAREAVGLTFGLALQNLGSGPSAPTGVGAPELPSRVTLGAMLPATRVGTYFDLAAAAAVARERGGRIVPAGGLELTYEPVAGWTFTGRVGARRVDGSTLPAESPMTFGASFGLDRFSLDYAYQPYRGSGAAHRIGVRIQ